MQTKKILSNREFKRTGLHFMKAAFQAQTIKFLQTQSARLGKEIAQPRPGHYMELHNPWSQAAAAYDTWCFLDICQSSILLETVTKLIGRDVILFDSHWLPDPWHPQEIESRYESDAHRFPVEPLRGITAFVCFAATPDCSVHFDYRRPALRHVPSRRGKSVYFEPGDVLIADLRIEYRIRVQRAVKNPLLYAIRYFPATSCYSRDAASPVHCTLTERYPLVNYTRLPLWLAHGCDRADNDFVTGFNVRAGYWTNANWA